MRVLLVVYDNASYVHHFPQGTAYIAGVLLQAGHEVEIWQQDIHHYPDSRLTALLDTQRFDVVGIGVIAGYYQYRRLLRLAEAINRARQRPFVVLGGHGPSADPPFFLRKTGADAVVVGEGEATILALLEALANHQPLGEVAGIAFAAGNGVTQTPRRPLIADLESIPRPPYHRFPMEVYRLHRLPRAERTDFVAHVLSGRGCSFQCIFCYRLDTGLRIRAPEAILDEVAYLQQEWGITYIDFSDELLMSSEERTLALCEAILRRGLTFKWSCNGRINYATRAVLTAMARAGCVFINYGIEAYDNQVLKRMKKGLRVEQIDPAIHRTLEAGISPGLNVIFGNPGDNERTLQQGVEFLLRFDDQSQLRTIRPVTPYPGSPLYYEAIERGLLADCEDFYEHKHLNSDLLAVNFTELSDEAFHLALHAANATLIDNYYTNLHRQARHTLDALYLQRDASFRGFRQG